jgi:ribosomal protein S18 acetylase RimI-like enzyme
MKRCEVEEKMIAIRRMQIAELESIAEIDRTERVKEIYVNRDGTLIRKDVDWHISRWPPPEMALWRTMLAAGGTLFGAFDGRALVGFSIYRPDLSQDTAQLAALYVSKDYRGRRIGASLMDQVAEMARADGAKKLYVSSTQTTATVDFYMSKGFALTKEINEHLYELEPEDIHMIENL